MTYYFHRRHRHQNTVTESLIRPNVRPCRHLRAARRQQSTVHFLMMTATTIMMMMKIFITFILIPESLGFQMAPADNSVRRSMGRNLWRRSRTLPPCWFCLPDEEAAAAANDRDDDILSFVTNNESITDAPKNIPDDDDEEVEEENEDITTGRNTSNETPAAVTTTTTDPNFMTDRFKYKVSFTILSVIVVPKKEGFVVLRQYV